MSSVVISGNTSGTITLDAPAVAGTTTLTLPATSGTVFVGGQALSATTGSFSGDLSFNSGYGSAAVAYGCRAWVNFDGTGTPAIRASGNVSSISDNGTGDYTINFTNALVDANYTATMTGSMENGARSFAINSLAGTAASSLPTTSSIRLACFNPGVSANDALFVNAAIFR